jgi:uncharacterized membrane protein
LSGSFPAWSVLRHFDIMLKNACLGVAALAAAVGLFFASYSTHDFVQHLDRQVHGLHCSFLPGIAAAENGGESGCHVTLMSPYSSVLRESVWGGIPISLPAMAVFAFLIAFALFVIIGGHHNDRRATGFYVAAWCVPAIASIGMGYVAFSTLDAACKLCIGIYASSAVGLLASIGALAAPRVDLFTPPPAPANADGSKAPPPPERSLSWGILGAAFGVGCLFVALPVLAYAGAAPDFSGYVGECGTLADASDPHRVLLPIGPQTRSVPVIEVIDPLCPSCRAFERRFDASSVHERTSRKVLLFPLDNTCNWMVDRAMHPGACAISEAVLCAEGDAAEVIDWAFDNQEAISTAAREDAEAPRRMARERFPGLSECIGSDAVRARLNASLRWTVQNELPVLTPQVYVGDQRLCDADTDLGMDYALTRLVDAYRPGAPRIEPEPPTETAVAPSEPVRAEPVRTQPAPAQPPPQAPPPQAPPPEAPAQPAADPAPAEPAPAEPAAEPAAPAEAPAEPAPSAPSEKASGAQRRGVTRVVFRASPGREPGREALNGKEVVP